MEAKGGFRTTIDANLAQFIASMRSFYIATASKDLMDYENRQRVKIWGTARVVDEDQDLIAKLFPEGYKARAEAAIIFKVQAWDGNCRNTSHRCCSRRMWQARSAYFRIAWPCSKQKTRDFALERPRTNLCSSPARNSRALFSFPAGSVWPVGEPPAARSSIRRFLMRASIAAMAASVGGALFLTAIRVGLVYVPYLLLLQ